MSFKEIKELRQAGKLEEALQMANQALEAEPDNIWNKRAAAWVYYDYLKKYSQPETFDLFKENLIKLKGLQLPEDEKMVLIEVADGRTCAEVMKVLRKRSEKYLALRGVGHE
jgi:tetratricopeptide (TPR) repeat protein